MLKQDDGSSSSLLKGDFLLCYCQL